jgi:hypothetical protein
VPARKLFASAEIESADMQSDRSPARRQRARASDRQDPARTRARR